MLTRTLNTLQNVNGHDSSRGRGTDVTGLYTNRDRSINDRSISFDAEVPSIDVFSFCQIPVSCSCLIRFSCSCLSSPPPLVLSLTPSLLPLLILISTAVQALLKDNMNVCVCLCVCVCVCARVCTCTCECLLGAARPRRRAPTFLEIQ